MEQKNKLTQSYKFLSRTSQAILMITFALCVIGVISVYSASLHTGKPFMQNAAGKQMIRMVLGLFVGVFIFFVQKKVLFQISYWLYGLGIMMVILPYLFGTDGTGTSRWVNFGGINLQPSELMKIIMVLAVAKVLSNTEESPKNFKIFILPVIMTLIPTAIILKQPDLGTSMILIFTLIPMLFWAEVRLFHLFLLIAPVVSIVTAFSFYSFFIWVILLGLVLYFTQEKWVLLIILFVFNLSLGFTTPILWNHLRPYQQERIKTMFNVEADPQGAGYQVIQSQVAIGSGGLWGKGFGQGTQTRLKFLPEQHTDFIFTVIGEEWGFAGVSITLLLYFSLIYLSYQTAYKLKDKYSSLVVVGLTSILFFHIMINIAMTVGLMPVTGLPLPFLSYGGTFVITCSLIIGLLLNMSVVKTRY
ncbi:MAG: rod shape-determining protein RodA [Candidatus Marinimicrobia bacterium]|nr:rod shape-determining protein RodA [Candidatus Neomarinimicrobiota bacterium]